MSAVAMIAAPVDRIANWLRGVEPVTGRSAARARFDAIGDFLFDHGLPPTVENFSFAQTYLGGENAGLNAAVEDLRRAGGGITARDVERITATRQPEPGPDALEELARELEARVGECIGAISESFVSTSEYSQALNLAAADLQDAPELTYNRLISLTLDVAETTRKISGRMETMHADTRRLQGELDRARRAAEEDHLTGLYNRRGFLDRLEAIVAEQPDGVRTIALCDIDNFKVVNDRHGHDVGDRVLTYVARQLRSTLGRSVLVARYGGEEFACLFEGVAPMAAAEMLDRVRDTLRTRSLRDQHSGEAIGKITFSAGLSPIVDDRAAAFRDADAALYAAKHAGKDRVLIAG